MCCAISIIGIFSTVGGKTTYRICAGVFCRKTKVTKLAAGSFGGTEQWAELK